MSGPGDERTLEEALAETAKVMHGVLAPVSNDIWITEDGKRIPIAKMDVDHARNVLAMVRRHGWEDHMGYGPALLARIERGHTPTFVTRFRNRLHVLLHPGYRRKTIETPKSYWSRQGFDPESDT